MTTDTDAAPLECSEDCGGNGYIDCWDCGGDGIVCVPDDDLTEHEETCATCEGEGGWPCPVCNGRDAWRVTLLKDGAVVYTSTEFHSQLEAAAWAGENARERDVELWCRPAGKPRFERTTFGWSQEGAQ